MVTILVIVHIMVCFFLIAVVLLQSGKGAELGAAFGGSSQTLFGSRGASTFLSKLTTIVAVIFMVTSLSLAIITTKGSTIIKKPPTPSEKQPTQAPQIPFQLPLQTPSKSNQQIPFSESKQSETSKQLPTSQKPAQTPQTPTQSSTGSK